MRAENCPSGSPISNTRSGRQEEAVHRWGRSWRQPASPSYAQGVSHPILGPVGSLLYSVCELGETLPSSSHSLRDLQQLRCPLFTSSSSHSLDGVSGVSMALASWLSEGDCRAEQELTWGLTRCCVPLRVCIFPKNDPMHSPYALRALLFVPLLHYNYLHTGIMSYTWYPPKCNILAASTQFRNTLEKGNIQSSTLFII